MKGPFLSSDILTKGTFPKIDAHVHTNWTDGRSTFEEYAIRAVELGLEAIAFTEHADDNSPWFNDYVNIRERIRELAAPVKIYFGAEVKVSCPDGTINLHPEKIKQLDFVMGVLHRYPDGNGGFQAFRDLSAQEAQEIDFALSKALLSNPLIDVWGHPGGVYATYFGAYQEDMLGELISLAVQEGKVIEINTKHRYRPVLDVIMRECSMHDCLISIGSDAHEVGELGEAHSILEDIGRQRLVLRDNC